MNAFAVSSPLRAQRGQGVVNFPFAAAVIVLAVNDHWLKTAFPSWFTGKLSDIAGLIAFPLLLQAFGEWVFEKHALRRPQRTLLLMIVATVTVFAAIKLWPTAAGVYRLVAGATAWLVFSARALICGDALPALGLGGLTMDATDLWTLPFCGVAYWLGTNRGEVTA